MTKRHYGKIDGRNLKDQIAQVPSSVLKIPPIKVKSSSIRTACLAVSVGLGVSDSISYTLILLLRFWVV